VINREVKILLLGLLPELYCYAREQHLNKNFDNTTLSFDDLIDMPEQADYRTVEHRNVNNEKKWKKRVPGTEDYAPSTIYSIFMRHTDNIGSDVMSQGRCLFLHNFTSLRKKYTASKFDKRFM